MLICVHCTIKILCQLSIYTCLSIFTAMTVNHQNLHVNVLDGIIHLMRIIACPACVSRTAQTSFVQPLLDQDCTFMNP